MRSEALSAETLGLKLNGSQLEEIETLGGLLGEPTLLVFLRHGG